MQSYLFQNYLDSLNKNIFLINQNKQTGGSLKKISYNPNIELIGGNQLILPELNANNFLSKLMEHKNLVVMFSVDWCGHCQKLKPIFEEAAANSNIEFARVDCDKEQNLAELFDIKSFPQIKKISVDDFKKIKKFEDERTIENIQNFANN